MHGFIAVGAYGHAPATRQPRSANCAVSSPFGSVYPSSFAVPFRIRFIAAVESSGTTYTRAPGSNCPEGSRTETVRTAPGANDSASSVRAPESEAATPVIAAVVHFGLITS